MNNLIAVQKIAGWQKLKTLVLDSVSSPITKRVYNMALDEFLGWFQHPTVRGVPTRVVCVRLRNTATQRPHAPNHVFQDGVDQGPQEGRRKGPVAR